jgi:integrase
MALDTLTALDVKRAYGKEDRLFLSDGGGLYLRKQTATGASWTLRYRFAGKDRWLALGNYPDMSLAEARVEARKARVLLDQGKDPMREKQAQIDAERRKGSFKELAEEWFIAEIKQRGIKHPEVPRRHLDKYLLPELGTSIAEDVRPADVAKLLDRVKVHAPTTANDLLRFAQRIFAFGVRRRLVTTNPAASFSPRLDAGGTERARKRALSYDELVTLFEALRNEPTFGGDNLLAIKLLLALCVRKGELLAAPWAEFDLEGAGEQGPVWHLPATRRKDGADLDIPLVPAVVGWLRALKELSGGSEYVFPKRRSDRRKRSPHVCRDTLNVAVARVTHGLAPFTLHDLRRTARTHLAALRIPTEVAERCLGHKLPGVEGIYNQHDYFTERRAALTQWTALLLDCESGKRKVTPIRRKV